MLNFIYSQDEIKYFSPPSFFNDIVKIDCENILSTEKLCKLKLTVKNTSISEFLVLDTKKVGFEYNELGTYLPSKGKNIIIPPSSKKSKVIKIDGSMDYRVNTFKIHVKSLRHGLKTNSMKLPTLNIEIGEKAEFEEDKVSVFLDKSISKKGKISLSLIMKSTLNEDELLNFNPEKLIFKDSKGNQIQYKVNSKKEFNFLGKSEKKYKYSFDSESSSFEISLENSFYLINLKQVKINPFSISNGHTTAPIPVTDSDVNCNSFTGQKTGLVEVLIMTDKNECFKMDVDDFTLVPTFSKVAKIYLNAGSRKFKITLDNGITVEKKVLIADMYSAIGYNVKMKSNGKYSIKYLPFKQVLNENGIKQRESMDK